MKLSRDDILLMEKLRKRQAFLRRWRVPLLIFHGLLMTLWFALLLVVVRFPSDNTTAKLIVVSYSLPPIFLFMALSSFSFGQTLWHWRGEPKTELLLRVLDELQKQDA